MINKGKFNVLGVNLHAVDYEYAVANILSAARQRRPLAVSALAVHGVMTGARDAIQRRRLNGLDMVVPDGQPVRWALRWLYGVRLPDRVYGPTLTLKVLEAVARERIPVYFYGSTSETIENLVGRMLVRFPGLRVAGFETSRFRRLETDERSELVTRITDSGAQLVFVGLGCPRQETWAFEYREKLGMPLLAVGAAFDFHAGSLAQAPSWMQRAGLEWLYRLLAEPRRLWKRYILLNPAYLFGILMQALRPQRTSIQLPDGFEPEESFG